MPPFDGGGVCVYAIAAADTKVPLRTLLSRWVDALAGSNGRALYRTDVPRVRSLAVSPPTDTGIGLALAPLLAAHPGQSGFALLEYGAPALLARAALADFAERSIDVQYYVYAADASGIVLTDRLVAAAGRGVRVRLLIDDNNLIKAEGRLAALTGYSNVEIRVFNPYRIRIRWLRLVESIARFGRVQRRMHNKIFAVDSSLLVVGGRNIGDHYFDRDAAMNFRDVELVCAGGVAAAATHSFDAYWNSVWAVPIEAFLRRAPTAADAAITAGALRDEAARCVARDGALPAVQAKIRALLEHASFEHWGVAELVADRPEKIDERRRADSPLLARVYRLWRDAEREVLVESAYLVPLRKGTRVIAARARAGIRVRMLTNSLASTDVPAVHSGYVKRRRRLLAAGVELYEFQVAAHRRPLERRYFKRLATAASLHSKVMVIDRRLTWIGSFNIDPRSALINTELAVIVDCPSLADATARLIESDLAPDRSWQVSLDPPGHRAGQLRWRGRQGGQPVQLTSEPGASLWLRLYVGLLHWLPGLDRLL